MFCSECGSQLSEDAKFCPECGVEITSEDSVIKVGQVIQENISKKKRIGKLPIIIGVAILVVVIIALNWNGKVDYVSTVAQHTPFANSQGLPYTYEEVLNRYLVSVKWEERDEGDIHYVDISGIAKEEEGKLDITIKVVPNSNDPDMVAIHPESVTLDDTNQLLEEEAVDFLYFLFCLYDEGYEDLSALTELDDKTDYITQDEVSPEMSMDSGISSGNSEPDICFNDISVSELLNFNKGEVIQIFGDDYYAGADGSMVYDEIEFYMIDDNTVGYITSFYPENFSINGYSLDDGSGEGVYSDRIIDFLGADYEEEYSDWYYMTYHYPTYTASFSVSKFNEVGNIKIYSSLYEQNGLIDDTILEPQDAIEAYWRLSGFYSASTGQSTLDISIYTSQEEGETEIGSVQLYADDGQYFVGVLIPIDEGTYKFMTDTGEEVILTESPFGNEVILQMYVDGQYLEEYRMTEHYES